MYSDALFHLPFLPSDVFADGFIFRCGGGGVKQYYLPDLGNATESYTPKWKLEYMTYGLAMFGQNGTDESQEVIPSRNLPRSLRHGRGAKYAPYSLDDLTIPSWIKLAQKLGDKENRKLRKKFKGYMFMGHGEEI